MSIAVMLGRGWRYTKHHVYVKHIRNAGGFVVTNGYITIVHNTTQKNIYTTTTPTSQDTNRYNTKIQIIAESEIVSEYGQEYKWTKSPEDNQWRPYPAQAKSEG